MCKVIAITNQKGRCAKTNVTVNLGIGLAREGDSDIQSIWESLHEKVYGEKGHLPHYYNFKVN